MRRFLSFGVVGAFGFAADAGVLALLVHGLHADPLLARIVSIGAALTLTWLLNRTFTFPPSRRHVAVEGMRYGGVGLASSLVNYLAYCAVLLALPWFPPLAALAVGSAVALLFSFFGYAHLVFDR